MDPQKKLKLLSKLASFECEKEPNLEGCIYEASTPKGKKPILKVMQSTYCDKNCDYCVFRRDREETVPYLLTIAYNNYHPCESAGIPPAGTVSLDYLPPQGQEVLDTPAFNSFYKFYSVLRKFQAFKENLLSIVRKTLNC